MCKEEGAVQAGGASAVAGHGGYPHVLRWYAYLVRIAHLKLYNIVHTTSTFQEYDLECCALV